jgi:hypothetical protein
MKPFPPALLQKWQKMHGCCKSKSFVTKVGVKNYLCNKAFPTSIYLYEFIHDTVRCKK